METIAYDEAVKLLPPGTGDVHTQMNPSAGVIVGADWPRTELLDAMRKAGTIYVTGPAAQAMQHGLAIMRNNAALFIATRGSIHGE